MSIESEIFDRHRPILGMLRPSKEDNALHAIHTSEISGGDFMAEVVINASADPIEIGGIMVARESGFSLSCRLYDPETDEEYAPIRREHAIGSYAASVREEYKGFLQNVADRSCMEVQFASDQANRLSAQLYRELGDEPDFPFDDDEDVAVWRVPANNKWYAIVMPVRRYKVTREKPADPEAEPYVDVMNVKIEPERLEELLGTDGIYECYHMNKKLWVSIILDGTLEDAAVMELIRTSRDLVKYGPAAKTKKARKGRASWIIPSNPGHYDVVIGFKSSPDNTISWTQRIKAEAGDHLYIYQTNPVASIMHKCEIVRANVPRAKAYGLDPIEMAATGSKKDKPIMYLKLLETYPVGLYSREFMNQHGISKTIRGQRSMPDELIAAMEELTKTL